MWNNKKLSEEEAKGRDESGRTVLPAWTRRVVDGRSKGPLGSREIPKLANFDRVVCRSCASGRLPSFFCSHPLACYLKRRAVPGGLEVRHARMVEHLPAMNRTAAAAALETPKAYTVKAWRAPSGQTASHARMVEHRIIFIKVPAIFHRACVCARRASLGQIVRPHVAKDETA